MHSTVPSDYRPGACRVVAAVLAGGVIKGAFECGALEVIVGAGTPITRVVGASAGALNALAFAGGVARGRAADALSDLASVWAHHASQHLLRPSMAALLSGQGLADAEPLLEILRAHVPPVREPAAQVELRMVVAPIAGRLVDTFWDPEGRTTFEKSIEFTEADFHPDRIEAVYRVAAASAALPFVYAPVDLPGLGPCVDGGAVDNAPIKHALHGTRSGGRPVDTVLVISPEPARRLSADVATLRGFEFGARLADLLINERLFRDLKEAYEVNRLVRVLSGTSLDEATRHELLAAIGIPNAREVKIVEVRPEAPLTGHLLSGFFSEELRLAYLAEGREAGRRALPVLKPAGS